MGANNSTKSPQKHKVRHQDGRPRQDIVRNKQQQFNDNNSNRLHHTPPLQRSQPEHNHRIHNGAKATQSRSPQAQHVHRGSAPTPHYLQHPQQHRTKAMAVSAEDLRPARQPAASFSSDDEEYLDVPAIIRSVPERGVDKVNVRDRISQFTESSSPVLPDRKSKPVPVNQSPAGGKGGQPSPLHTPRNGEVRRGSDVTGVLSNRRGGEDSPPTGASIPHLLPRHQLPSAHDQRRASEQPGNQKSSGKRDEDPVLPDVDYEIEKEGSGKEKYHRMNTLEYLNQVPREQAILKGFEKAKPAARNRKGVSPQINRINKPKHLRDEQLRPQSMFSPTMYSSDLDLASQSAHNLISTQEDLASINNKTGQKYAIDDTAYETMSRKKKIAGQRLPIGEVDEQTESNFLKSLKRNIKLRQARQRQRADSEVDGGPNISDMRF